MLEAERFFEDWGPWGWFWAVGLYAFLLGTVVTPWALSGQIPWALPLTALPGAILMRAAARQTMALSNLETNI